MQSMCEKGLKYAASEGLLLGTISEFRYTSSFISCNGFLFKKEAQNWLIKLACSHFRIFVWLVLGSGQSGLVFG